MLARKLLGLLVLLSVMSCTREEQANATINYYITAPRSSNFHYIEFTFDYLRVIQNDGSRAQTVIGSKQITINLEDPAEIFLGSAAIEPELIEEYQYSISNVMVVRENDTISLSKPQHADDRTPTSIFPSEGQILNLNLVLDVDASTVIGVAGGENWVNPQIAIQHGAEPIW